MTGREEAEHICKFVRAGRGGGGGVVSGSIRRCVRNPYQIRNVGRVKECENSL
jgi:hypothetical protein